MDGIFPVQFPVLPGRDVAGVMEARRNDGKVILLP
jgi:hypothetical protein